MRFFLHHRRRRYKRFFSLFRFPFQDRFLYFNDLINIRGERTINATRIAIIKMKAVFRWLFFSIRNILFFSYSVCYEARVFFHQD